MLPNEVDALLKGYKENRGRCGYLESQVDKLERQIKQMDNEFREDILYGSHSQFAEKPSTGELVWLPKGNTTGDPTGSAAIKLTEGSKETIRLSLLLGETQEKLNQVKDLVKFVDAWMIGLNEREQWIIQEQVIEGKFWREVTDAYSEKYGTEFSKDSLKYIKENAMAKIYRMAE